MLKYKLRNVLLFLVVVLAVVSACHKDNVSPKPTLLSFGPSTVSHGDTIKFIGTNLNQITDVVMPVGIDIPKSAFLTQTSTLIELVVPELSMMGHVVLKYGKSDSIVSKSVFGAAYTITVHSFSPTSARAGDNITINGNFLNYVKQVTFNTGQNIPQAQFVSQSLHQLVVQVPLAAQTGLLSLTDLAGSSAQVVSQDTLLNDLIVTVALPTATSLSPTSIYQSQNLTIAGTNLDLVTSIIFPTAASIEQKTSGTVTNTTPGTVSVLSTSFVSQTTTQIVVNVPATAITGALTLNAPSGLNTTTSSLTIIEPAVTTMSTGRVGVENVTITGTNLDIVSSITFPGKAVVASSAFVSQSATQIVAAIPASATPGNLTLTTATSFPVVIDGYTVTLPVATAYSSTNAGQPTTITGTDLDLVTSIKFPDGTIVAAPFTSQSSTSITVGVPATSTSAGTLTLIIANGYNVPQTLGFGGCSTSFSGLLLFDFAKASQVTTVVSNVNSGSTTTWSYTGNGSPEGYGNNSLSSSNWDNTGGHTCPGELTISVPVYANGINYISNFSSGQDFSAYTEIHMWIKITGGGLTSSTLNGIQPILKSTSSGYIGAATGAVWEPTSGTYCDGNWHELVFNISGLSATDISSITNVGFQLLPQGTVTSSIPATIYVDDVWVK